jgi:hypothetical protein
MIHPNLYKNWKCPQCNNDDENFEHIFNCDANRTHIKKIEYLIFQLLVSLIKKFTRKNNENILSKPSYSTIKTIFKNNGLSFADLIKGLFPIQLTEMVNQHINNMEVTKMILSITTNEVYYKFKEIIWNERCNKLIEKEKQNNITKRIKKKRVKGLRSHVTNNNNSTIRDVPLYTKAYGYLNSIQIGGQWVDYYTDNLFLFSFG